MPCRCTFLNKSVFFDIFKARSYENSDEPKIASAGPSSSVELNDLTTARWEMGYEKCILWLFGNLDNFPITML